MTSPQADHASSSPADDVKSPGSTTAAAVGADAADSNLTVRALVSTKEAGVIIGKGGANVADLREQTGVKAGVSKVVQGVHDRVLSVSGNVDGISHAYSLIAQTILENPVVAISSPPASSSDAAPSSPTAAPATGSLTSVRLLISHNLMGTVIGRQGLKIKHIQDVSGARMVASKDMLPQSTERIVEVQGTPEAIRVAVYEIAKCLLEDSERGQGTIHYHPGQTEGAGVLAAGGAGGLHPQTTSSGAAGGATRGHRSSSGSGAGYLAGTMGGLSLTANASNRRASNTQRGAAGINGTAPSSAAVAAAAAAAAREAAAGAAVVTPGGALNVPTTGADGSSTSPSTTPAAGMPPAIVDSSLAAPSGSSVLRTQNISIPADMVGCIIGKGGSKITEIRRLSGSRISIAKVAHDDSGERMFTIQGTPEANEKALFLLYTQLESEKERRTQTGGNGTGEQDGEAGGAAEAQRPAIVAADA